MTFEEYRKTLKSSVDEDVARDAWAIATFEATAAERERCAVKAWKHYMDTCKKKGIAPATCEEWLCSEAIRKGGD